MTPTATENLDVCADCVQFGANGNYSEFQECFEPARWRERQQQLIDTQAKHRQAGRVWLTSSDLSLWFSRRPCEWCGDKTDGERWRAYVAVQGRR